VGWQVVMDGMEISQFTYFQQAGGVELSPISVELTYGLERICMFLNDIRNIFEIPWNDDRDLRAGAPRRGSGHVPLLLQRRRPRPGARAVRGVGGGVGTAACAGGATERVGRLRGGAEVLAPLQPAGRAGAISVTERAAFIGRIRKLAVRCADAWLARREAQEFPLLPRETLKAVTRT
jgi:glycyl-tRNA synthetase alpha chain